MYSSDDKTQVREASSRARPLGAAEHREPHRHPQERLRLKRHFALPFLLLLGPLFPGTSITAQDTTFQVVIHAENPTTELAAATVARMFLKKHKRWDHGVLVEPVDLEAKSPIRKVFTKSVHGKSVTAIKSFWQRMIFSGRASPPPAVTSDLEVLDYVRRHPGAVGYVAVETPLGQEIKILPLHE